MPFTDDDLKRIQDILDSQEPRVAPSNIHGLVERLRAAENVIDTYIAKDLSYLEGPDAQTHNKNVDDFIAALYQWWRCRGQSDV